MDHTIVHFEIPASNVGKLKTFYEGLFGWKIVKTPMEGMEYWLIHTVPTDDKGMSLRPGVNGGLFQKQPQQEGMIGFLPAGVEAVDSSLATTSVVGQPPQLNQAGLDQPWGWWYFTHTDLRDEKAVLFATFLPQGAYEYTYTVRAAIPGTYRVIPTHAEQMYFPEVFGRSDGGGFEVTDSGS